MNAARCMPFDVTGDMTLLDLILVVQEFTRSDDETVAAVSSLLRSGRVRLRAPRMNAQGNGRSRPAASISADRTRGTSTVRAGAR